MRNKWFAVLNILRDHWKLTTGIVLGLVFLVIFLNPIWNILEGVVSGHIKIKSPWVEIEPTTRSIKITAQELGSLTTISAYHANLRDREDLLAGFRNQLDPDRLDRLIDSDVYLCSLFAGQLDFCSPKIQKELSDLKASIAKKKPGLNQLLGATNRGDAALARKLADELDAEKGKFSGVSYYYTLRAALESYKSFKDEDVLPFLFEGLGKLPRDPSLNFNLGYYLSFSGRDGSLEAAIFFFEQALYTMGQTKILLASNPAFKSPCKLLRYDMSEATLSNAVAWFMSLQGNLSYREDALIHIERAISLLENNLKPCLRQDNYTKKSITYSDTYGFVFLRFGRGVDDFKKATGIFNDAVSKAQTNGYTDLAQQVRAHYREAEARSNLLSDIERLYASSGESSSKSKTEAEK